MVTAAELLHLADRLAALPVELGIADTPKGQTLTCTADYLEETAGRMACLEMRRERCADFRLSFPAVDGGADDDFEWRPATDIAQVRGDRLLHDAGNAGPGDIYTWDPTQDVIR